MDLATALEDSVIQPPFQTAFDKFGKPTWVSSAGLSFGLLRKYQTQSEVSLYGQEQAYIDEEESVTQAVGGKPFFLASWVGEIHPMLARAKTFEDLLSQGASRAQQRELMESSAILAKAGTVIIDDDNIPA